MILYYQFHIPSSFPLNFATKLVMEELSRDCLRDTSANSKKPYHTRKYFEERLFRSLFFFAPFGFILWLLRLVFHSYFGSLLELLLLLCPVWSDFWKVNF